MDGYHNKQKTRWYKKEKDPESGFGWRLQMEYKLRCGRKRKEKRANARRGTGWGTYLVEELVKEVSRRREKGGVHERATRAVEGRRGLSRADKARGG